MLKLEIITPEKIAYTDEVDMVVVPSKEGMLGILPHHMPLFAALSEGELKIKKGDEEYFLSIGGGYVEVSREKVIILVTKAVHAHELNEAEITKARQKAHEDLKQKLTPESVAAARMMLRQTLVDAKIYSKRRRQP
jgi:F-type H+-transporting ATPase subunit epsilon